MCSAFFKVGAGNGEVVEFPHGSEASFRSSRNMSGRADGKIKPLLARFCWSSTRREVEEGARAPHSRGGAGGKAPRRSAPGGAEPSAARLPDEGEDVGGRLWDIRAGAEDRFTPASCSMA